MSDCEWDDKNLEEDGLGGGGGGGGAVVVFSIAIPFFNSG
jgi:hypothetical protein